MTQPRTRRDLSDDTVVDDEIVRDPEATAIKNRAVASARERYGDEFPEGFRFYFRRYGRGGRWRGVTPHGSWVECTDEVAARRELWWMVALWAMEAEAVTHQEGDRDG